MRLHEADILALDAEDAESVLRRMGVSERFIEWFWRSASMSIMNVPLERCSAGALLSFFRYMLGRSAYQIGFAAEGLAGLFAPPARRRIEQVGGRVLLGTEATNVLVQNDSFSGVRLSDGSVLRAEQCVAALPPKRVHRLLPSAWTGRHQVFRDLTGFEESPYVSIYIWFDRKLTLERFWARVWSPANIAYDFYDLSNIRRAWAGRASLIACNSVYSRYTGKLSDRELIAGVIRELAEFAPEAARANIRHVSVHRIPMAIPAPYPGSEQLRPEVDTPMAGFFLAGDWIKTGLPASMESAVRAGRLAAEAVLAARGRKREIALPLPGITGVASVVAN